MRIKLGKRASASFFLILLVSSFFVSFSNLRFVSATTVFSDGFESGDLTEWTSSSGTISAVDTYSHHGTYSAKVTAASSGYVYKTFTGQSTVYVRGYFRFDSINTNQWTLHTIMRLWSDSGSIAVLKIIKYDQADNLFTFQLGGLESGSIVTNDSSNIAVDPDHEYCIEVAMVIHGSTGAYYLYIDGEEIIAVTGKDTNDYGNVDKLSIGLIEASAGVDTLHLDCVEVADAYIGEEIESAYPYVNNVSNVDSVADIGTHSNFTAQQYAPDLVNDTLTEYTTNNLPQVMNNTVAEGEGTTASTQVPSDTEAGDMIVVICTTDGTGSALGAPDGSYNVLRAESQSEGQTTASWYKYSAGTEAGTTVSSAWSGTEEWIIGAIRIANAGAVTNTTATTFSSGDPVFPAIQTTYDNSVVLRFWGMDDDDDPEPIAGNPNEHTQLWARETSGAGGQCSQAATYYNATSAGVVASATFNQAATAEGGVAVSVVIAPIINYELQIEEQFTEVPYSEYDTAKLCVFAGTFGGAEGLNIQVWNGTWNTVGAVVANQWNNLTVTSFVNSSDLYIRFIGNSESSDTSQDTWQIDAVFLWMYDDTSQHLVFVLYATASFSDSTISQKGIGKTLTQTIVADSVLDSQKALTKPLFASVAVSSDFGSTKGISNVFSETVAALFAFDSVKSLFQNILETLSASLSVDDLLTTQKGLLKFLSGTVAVNSILESQKWLTKIIMEVANINSALNVVKGLFQNLFENLSATLTVDDLLSTQKGLLKFIADTLTANDALVSQKWLTKIIAEVANINSALSAAKSLLKNLMETLSATFSVNDLLTTQKNLLKFLSDIVTATVDLSALKSLSNIIVEVIGTVNIDSLLSTVKTLHTWLMEFFDTIHLNSVLKPHLPTTEIFTMEDIVVGAIVGALIAAVTCYVLFVSIRKKNEGGEYFE